MFIRLGEVGTASKTAEISDFMHKRQQDIIVVMAVEELGIETSSVPSRRHSVPSFSCRGHGSIYKDGQKVIWEERPPGLIIINKILSCALLFVSQMGNKNIK